jgi:hypothetical protein
MSRVDQLVVPALMSPLSTRSTWSPRMAASLAIAEPLMPAPTMITSKWIAPMS